MEDCGEKSISNVKEIRNLKWKTKPKLKFFVWYLWLNPTITFLLLFSSFVMSDSWWPHGHLLSYPSHAKLPCPSQSPRVCSNSCSWSWWCHPNNSSSVAPFSSCPQSFFFFLPSIFPSIRVFSNESAGRIRWPENWSFSFSISPSNEYSGLIDWFKLLAVQGTLKSLVQHHNSKTSITAVSINKNVTVISHCSPPKWAGEAWGNSGWISAI